MDAGYAVLPGLFAAAEMERLAAALAGGSATRSRAGTRHLMGNDTVRAVANDDRLIALASRALGDGAVPYRATLFDKSPEANWLVAWHQDTALPLRARFERAGWGPWSEKLGVVYAHAPATALCRVIALRLHLDDSHEDNGPLRVIPGSHLDGVLTDEQVSARAARDPHVTCLVDRGGVIAMRPLIIHASSKAKSSEARRVLHVEYAASLELERGIELRAA